MPAKIGVVSLAMGAIAIVAFVALFPLDERAKLQTQTAGETATAVLAGGCFWCVEADFEKLDGVIDVVSGYSGGTSEDPTYENYALGGHREVVLVTYDPSRIAYAGLVEYLIKHSDPTDPDGSFYDRGPEYAPAVYYASEDEKRAAESVVSAIDAMRVFDVPLAVEVLPQKPFYPAEDYHQDYARRNSLRYSYYRNASGRDAFVQKHWGSDTEISLSRNSSGIASAWSDFVRPSDEDLRRDLTEMQYYVTQENGTEQPFNNEYWDEKREGIYVDVVSGVPLFSSTDKFDSGTGWPSFTKPLSPERIVHREDRTLFVVRTEVRSRDADSPLGHVFNDAPPERGGIRYCMNSAALRFVPKESMAEEGYAEFLSLFN